MAKTTELLVSLGPDQPDHLFLSQFQGSPRSSDRLGSCGVLVESPHDFIEGGGHLVVVGITQQ